MMLKMLITKKMQLKQILIPIYIYIYKYEGDKKVPTLKVKIEESVEGIVHMEIEIVEETEKDNLQTIKKKLRRGHQIRNNFL